MSPGLVAFSSSAATRAKAFLASEAPPAAKPSCHASSPHRVRTTVPSGFLTGLPGEILLPTSTTRSRLRQLLDIGFLHHGINADKFLRSRAGKEVIQRQHRVRLAAAEVGLELHDRIAACAVETLDRPDQEPSQAFGEIGAAEELDRLPVFIGSLAEMNLPEIGGELGLLIPAAGHVLVRRDDFAPGLERSVDAASISEPPALRFSLRTCSSKRRRKSSFLVFSSSSACGAEIASKRRCAESSAR